MSSNSSVAISQATPSIKPLGNSTSGKQPVAAKSRVNTTTTILKKNSPNTSKPPLQPSSSKFSAISPKTPTDTCIIPTAKIASITPSSRRASVTSPAAVVMTQSKPSIAPLKPVADHQATDVKPINPALKPSTVVPQLSTSKVWVLPPRPKPGRKPSTDTPPTVSLFYLMLTKKKKIKTPFIL